VFLQSGDNLLHGLVVIPGPALAQVTSTTAIAAGSTFIWAMDYDGTNLRLFLNGNLEATTAVASLQAPDAVTPLYIGQNADTGNNGWPFQGTTDAVRLSNISRGIVSYTPATAPFVSDANTLALYHMDATPKAGFFLLDGKVHIDRKIASEVAQLFGQTAPSFRYGVYNYRTLDITPTQRLSDIAGMEAVLNAVLSGSTLCYRDIFNGAVIYCLLPISRKYVDDLYQDVTLQLVETAFTFTP
jgi:hypothetical protein